MQVMISKKCVNKCYANHFHVAICCIFVHSLSNACMHSEYAGFKALHIKSMSKLIFFNGRGKTVRSSHIQLSRCHNMANISHFAM